MSRRITLEEAVVAVGVEGRLYLQKNLILCLCPPEEVAAVVVSVYQRICRPYNPDPWDNR